MLFKAEELSCKKSMEYQWYASKNAVVNPIPWLEAQIQWLQMQKEDYKIPGEKRKAVGDFHLQWWRWFNILTVYQFQTEGEMHEKLLFTKMFTGLLFTIQKVENYLNVHQ